MTIDDMIKQAAELTESEMYKIIMQVIIELRNKGHADVEDLSESFAIIRYERMRRTDAYIDKLRFHNGLIPRLPMGE